jgi:aminomethyltransferase
VIVYLVDRDDVLAMPNAANAAEIARLLRAAAPPGVEVIDRHRELAVLAVQGPRSAELVGELLGPVNGRNVVEALDYMSFTVHDEAWVCRTGYTGERGYELIVPAALAGQAWDTLVDGASRVGGRPAGLAARDTLRTEMGYPLHGQELTTEISPLQAGSAWAVGWDKSQFWGREALLAERAAGPRRRLRGLLATGRGVPRAGMDVLVEGKRVGVTTSGTFSPTLRTGIALALVDTDAGVALDAPVTVDVRGRELACTVVRPPFVPSHVR